MLARRHRLPLALLLGLTAVLFLPFWAGGRVFVPGDFLSFIYPWKAHAAEPRVQNLDLFDVITLFVPVDTLLHEGLREGRIPLWNPYIFCGHPVVASGQSGFFYPVRLALHAVLDVGQARTVMQWLHLLLSGVGMYALLARRGRSAEAAALGAVAWMLNAFATGWMEYEHVPVLSALMMGALVALDAALDGRRAGYPVGAVLLGLGLLAGHLQLNLYVLATVAFYVGWRAWERRSLAGVPQAVMAVAAAFLISAPSLLPFKEFLDLSARRHFTFEQIQEMASPLWMILPTMVCPDAWGNPALGFMLNRTTQNYVFPEFACYAGVLPLVLALALLADREGRRRNAPLYGLLVLALLAAAATPLYHLAVLVLPFLSQLIPGRVLFLVPFALALLAAESADRLRDSAGSRRAAAWVAATVAGAWALWVLGMAWWLQSGPTLAPAWIKVPAADPAMPPEAWQAMVEQAAWGVLLANPQVLLSFLLPGLLAGWLWAKRPVDGRVLMVLALLTGADLLTFATRFNPAVPPETLFPPVPSVAFLQAQDPLERVQTHGAAFYDTLMPYRVSSVQGYESLVLRRYLDLLDRVEGEAVNMRTGSITRQDSPILDMLGTRWALENPHFEPLKLDLAHQDGMRIFRRPGTLPRAWAVGRVAVLDGREALDFLSRPDFDPRREATVPEPLVVDEAATGSEVRVLEYGIDRVVLEAMMRDRGLVVLADAWYPGWEATVDGLPERLLRANHSLRGVPVAEGRHRLEFHFRPRSLRVGLWLALAGLVLAGALAYGRPTSRRTIR